MRTLIEVFQDMGCLVGQLADLRTEARELLAKHDAAASKGGRAKTPRKQKASRANGKKGGRPRKVTK